MATSISTTQDLRIRSLKCSPNSPAVLLATADRALQANLQAALRGWGHPVETVADSTSLLQKLERPESAPIVILDADLPGLHSMTLLHRLQLQSTRRRSWTILLSAHQSVNISSSASAHDTGVDDVLTKPVDEFELRVSLRAAARVQSRFAEMAQALEAASFHSTHDRLTGLLNRESLLNLLFQETDRTQRLGSQLAFLLLDLDHFSLVNREHGYDGGDYVLQQLASRFRRYLRSYDLTGRCGGDQFLIAMPGCTHEDARSMAARLRDCVSERSFDILQASISITASIGIAQSSGRSPLTVLREAETALGHAKLAGGACARWFPTASLAVPSLTAMSIDAKPVAELGASQTVKPRQVNAKSVAF